MQPEALYPMWDVALEESKAQVDQVRKLHEMQACEEAPVQEVNDSAHWLGRHGAWLSGSGKVVPVEATNGHADVAEAITGLTIRYPADYQQLYRLQWARLTNTPSAIYVTYGKESLSSEQLAALNILSKATMKPVYLDDDGTTTCLCALTNDPIGSSRTVC